MTDNVNENLTEKEASIKEEDKIRQIKMDTIAEYNMISGKTATNNKNILLLIGLLLLLVIIVISSLVKYNKTMSSVDEQKPEVEVNMSDDTDDVEYIELH